MSRSFLGQTKPPTYSRWTVPFNNAKMGLGALGELYMRSRGPNGRLHSSFLSPVPPSKWDTCFGSSRWWHCGLASKNCTEHLMTRSAQTKKKIKKVYWSHDA